LTNERPSEELLKRLENLPPAEPRSKLEPLRAYILRWRRQGRSYRRIQRILREHCQMEVAYETLRRFVQRRQKPRTAEPAVETEPGPVNGIADGTRVSTAGNDPYAEARERMRKFKAEPVPVHEPAKRLFEYDPNKPLTIDRSIKD
jgi:hypothetical protein